WNAMDLSAERHWYKPVTFQSRQDMKRHPACFLMGPVMSMPFLRRRTAWGAGGGNAGGRRGVPFEVKWVLLASVALTLPVSSNLPGRQSYMNSRRPAGQVQKPF